MTEQKSVRQRARERGALDGADAQALEHALTVTERERDEAQANYRFMVERAADEKLDGYRELLRVSRAAKAFRDWDAIGALLSGDEPHAEDAQNDLRELDDALRRAVLSTPLGAFCCPEEP